MNNVFILKMISVSEYLVAQRKIKFPSPFLESKLNLTHTKIQSW